MTVKAVLQDILEEEEKNSVSNSFGGVKCQGRTPSYNIAGIAKLMSEECVNSQNDEVALLYSALEGKLTAKELIYLMSSAIRFSFLIELTNLSITSTKLKTRWYPGRIIKTLPDTFQNYQADFKPGNDQRASTFDQCYDVFKKILADVLVSKTHLDLVKALSITVNRCVSYECVFTYIDSRLEVVHVPNNVRLVHTSDIQWLVQYRKVIHSPLTPKNINKIITKTYLTDRSQTGADQTNRAKRWEVLSADFQHATLEECWSVERELLSQLLIFRNFPAKTTALVATLKITTANHVCPITLKELDFADFKTASEHGRSAFQVGHLTPLKRGGRHTAKNVAWVTQDGNRIQGDLTLDEVQKILDDIYIRRLALNKAK